MNSDSDSDVHSGSDGDSIEESSAASDIDGSFASDDDSFEESIYSVDSYVDRYMEELQRIKDNDSDLEMFTVGIVHFTDQEFEELGVDISNNTHLKVIYFDYTTVNDYTASFFFSGLRRSCSIERMHFSETELSVVGVRSMVPFLQNTCNLRKLRFITNNIQSEGFNIMFRALRDSPIEEIHCNDCGIESIDIDESSIPRKLVALHLHRNAINSNGCRELAKLLKGKDYTLTELDLKKNKIDDDGVAYLVDALRNNTSLKSLRLHYNGDISPKGLLMLLKLVNDTSCVKSTLRSNHTLTLISLDSNVYGRDDRDKSETYLLQFFSSISYVLILEEEVIGCMIDKAVAINKIHDGNAEAAGKEKLIQQLRRDNSAVLGKLQGVNQTLYSEIDSLHLPEVLSLVGRRHGQDELYVAFKSSIADVISVVNRRECIRQKRDHYAALVEQLNAELAAIDASAR